MNLPHRKKIQHYDEQAHVHGLTFSCYQRLPLLTDYNRNKELCTSLNRALIRHNYHLLAYVLMPEHVHLVVHPQIDHSSISDLLSAIKRPFSYRVKNQMIESGDPLLKQLMIRQRPGVMTFRFWQEGPGYDRNLTESKAIISAIEYIHLNPVRRGLCEKAIDWKWSSARWYEKPFLDSEPTLHRPSFDMLD